MKFDTNQAETDKQKALHPEGTWDAVVIGAAAKPTRTGKEMIQLDWKTSVGTVRSWHTYVPAYPGLFLEPMYALGLTKEYFAEDRELADVAVECLKRRALLGIVHDAGANGLRANVQAVLPLPDNGIKPSA